MLAKQAPKKKPVALIGKSPWKSNASVRQAREHRRWSVSSDFPFIPYTEVDLSRLRLEKGRHLVSRATLGKELEYWNKPAILRRIARERLSLIKDLAGQGFKVKLVLEEAKLSEAEKKFADLAVKAGASIGATREHSVLNTPFVRDAFSYISGIRFVFSPDIKALTAKNPDKTMKPSAKPHAGRKWYYSYLGEGGAVVNIGNNCVLVGEPTAKKAVPEIRFLEKQGIKVFRMPMGFIEAFKTRAKNKSVQVYRKTHHLDLLINCVPGKRILVVDQMYYADNQGLVDQITGSLGYRLLKVPEKEGKFFPANFFDLGKGRILVNRGAKQTIEKLRGLGVDAVPTTRALRASAILASGARCAINLPLHSMKRVGLA